MILLPPAVADIEEATARLKRLNPQAALNFRRAMANAFRLIGDRPLIGRSVGGKATREWSVTNWPYVVPYRVVDKNVEVLRVWHTRQDRPDDWEGKL